MNAIGECDCELVIFQFEHLKPLVILEVWLGLGVRNVLNVQYLNVLLRGCEAIHLRN